MNKMRIVGRIVAGALASAVLMTAALAAPAQAKDTGWPQKAPADTTIVQLKDTGWPM